MRDQNMAYSKMGALIASRLKGPVEQFINSLSYTDPNGMVLVYPDFLVVHDNQGETDHEQEEIRVKYMCQRIIDQYKADDEDVQYATLESFFKLQQGNTSIEDYVANHELAFQDAASSCNLQMNDVGRSFFLLEGSNITVNNLLTSACVVTVSLQNMIRSNNS